MLDRTQTTTSIMVRDDLPSAGIEFDFKGFAGYPVALGGDYTYTLAWTKRIPDIVSITADGIEKYVLFYITCISNTSIAVPMSHVIAG